MGRSCQTLLWGCFGIVGCFGGKGIMRTSTGNVLLKFNYSLCCKDFQRQKDFSSIGSLDLPSESPSWHYPKEKVHYFLGLVCGLVRLLSKGECPLFLSLVCGLVRLEYLRKRSVLINYKSSLTT